MNTAITTFSYIIAYMSYFMWLLYMLCVPKAIHIFQQESYQLRDYFRWIYKNPKKAFGPGARQFIICMIYFLINILIAFAIIKFGFSEEQRALVYCIQLFAFYVL